MSELQLWMQHAVTNWLTNPVAWMYPGVWAQLIAILLATLTVLRMLHNDIAGGRLFDRRGSWVLFGADCLFLFLVLVFPSLTVIQFFGSVLVASFAIFAILARRHWNRPAAAPAPAAAPTATPTS